MGNRYTTSKIVNDPVHGFITLEYSLLQDILDHPWMQRLRRIRQLGMTNLVYPGAQHTRFQHSLGAIHLIHQAITTLQDKGVLVTEEEQRGAMAAMLMHDIGHGPFSHVLEHTIVNDISHEEISRVLMDRMNHMMGGRLNRCIEIFDGHCKPFLHQLISSQLDTDRMDYLKRDSFFTGVTEGNIGCDRILKMFDVVDDQLAIESKGIFSIEKFLIARRLMYWQVYLHKTVIASERMLTQILRRAKWLSRQGRTPFAPPQLEFFLENEINSENFDEYETIRNYTLLDDNDIMSSIKVWTMSSDKTLATLSTWFLNRHLFRIEMTTEPFDESRVEELMSKVCLVHKVSMDDAAYFVTTGKVSSKTYTVGRDKINVKFDDGSVADISDVSQLNLEILGNKDTEWYLCYPRGI